MKTGVLLINLGTPDQPHTREVGRYLREFLMDPYVIDIPYLARWILVNGAIVPFRAPRSAQAYQKIWRAEGSPLKYYHLRLTQLVSEALAPLPVVAGMRYGEPSLSFALAQLKEQGVSRVLVVPLYPQYALASTTSSLEKTRALANKMSLEIVALEDFYRHTEFVAAEVAVAAETLGGHSFDHYLFSYHGLPVRHLKKAANPECLASTTCCDSIGTRNRYCYRAQCVATTRAIAQGLHLRQTEYSISFQSRLGRTPWIQPFTDFEYERLARAGVRRLAVFCPSFVADCLETLEEIAIRGREQFLSVGGEELVLIPSLNDHSRWVQAVTAMVRELDSSHKT